MSFGPDVCLPVYIRRSSDFSEDRVIRRLRAPQARSAAVMRRSPVFRFGNDLSSNFTLEIIRNY